MGSSSVISPFVTDWVSAITEDNFEHLVRECMNTAAVLDSSMHHLIGGIYSQLKPAGWWSELYYDRRWDDDAHFLLDGVMHGFHVVDSGARIEIYHCVNYRSSTCGSNKSQLQDILVEDMLNHKISVAKETPVCVHALGAIRKASGAIRPITDCKRPLGNSVNCYMKATFSTFSYVSCDDAIDLMSPGCWMSCVDLQSAYRSVTIHSDDWTFCGLEWDFGDGPVLLTNHCISFGQRSAPFIFSRITDFVSRKMRYLGFNCLGYMYDFFLVETSREPCTLAMNSLMVILRRLGFHIAYKKLSPPSQRCRFLGIELNSVACEARLPHEKVLKLQQEIAFFS